MSHKQIMFTHKCNSYKTFTVYPVWGANDTQHKDTKRKGLEGEGATNKLCLDTSATHIRLFTVFPVWGANETQHKDTKRKGLE